TTPTLCVRRSRNAAPGRASNQCPDASTLRLSVPFFIVTETSSSASSTNSSTSAPSPRDTKNTPTTTSHSSSSLPSEYGCDLMSLCLRPRNARASPTRKRQTALWVPLWLGLRIRTRTAPKGGLRDWLHARLASLRLDLTEAFRIGITLTRRQASASVGNEAG